VGRAPRRLHVRQPLCVAVLTRHHNAYITRRQRAPTPTSRARPVHHTSVMSSQLSSEQIKVLHRQGFKRIGERWIRYDGSTLLCVDESWVKQPSGTAPEWTTGDSGGNNGNCWSEVFSSSGGSAARATSRPKNLPQRGNEEEHRGDGSSDGWETVYEDSGDEERSKPSVGQHQKSGDRTSSRTPSSVETSPGQPEPDVPGSASNVTRSKASSEQGDKPSSL